VPRPSQDHHSGGQFDFAATLLLIPFIGGEFMPHLRLRPIVMTALVACLGLLPAALSTGIGSETQRPFAIVIVAGLISRLFLGFFVNPVLYEMVAREGDVLQV
jgi:Cu/Ag efflux pump CusA